MPGVVPDSRPRAFQRQSYSRPPAFWVSSLTLSSVPVSLPASLLEKRGLLAASAPGRVSWMQDSDSWDHPLLLLPPSEDDFMPFSLFHVLGFSRRDSGWPEASALGCPVPLQTSSCNGGSWRCRSSSDLPAASGPRCCRAVRGKNGLFRQSLPICCVLVVLPTWRGCSGVVTAVGWLPFHSDGGEITLDNKNRMVFRFVVWLVGFFSCLEKTDKKLRN